MSWNTVNKKQNGLEQIEMKNIKAYLELEPNFPGVDTPQSSEWIIYIIAYAYNPFTAPWGDCEWEQWERNKTKKQRNKARRNEWKRKDVK